MSGLIYSIAAELWRDMKADYTLRLDASFHQADNDCHGHLLNKAGRDAHISAWELFRGSETYAYRYASRELVEWWALHGRLTLSAFEAQWLNGRGDQYAYEAHWGATN
ncbi:hypothetical protein [Glutamicibacter halophytocola]|uniref:hypothetical protein n=1 Tax=Glutamicibacter halophytocola TaxID=1933880 RepID=UPI0015C523A2|nr:hypothetical protein [Glutamicibacter halophytocola]NQD40568.1 hypothetical protein [Glutamicibacter halophytocola]